MCCINCRRSFKIAINHCWRRATVISICRIQRAVIPPPITAIGIRCGHINHAVVARTSRDAEVIGRPVVAVAAAVFAQRGAGGAGVIGKLQVEAVGAVGACILLGPPDACDEVGFAEAAWGQRLAVDEVNLG